MASACEGRVTVTRIAKSLLGGSVAFGLFGAVAPQADAALVYGLTEFSNNIIAFDTNAPNVILSGREIVGLEPNEKLHAIDYRPATSELYGLGTQSRLYRIDPNTGQATAVASGRFIPNLDGPRFGFDFNPTVDRIRVTSNANQNLRLHPDTAMVVAIDGNLAYNAGDPNFGIDPNIVASAYTNNDIDPLSPTLLYGIDTNLDVLVLQNPPNAGGLMTIGSLGVDATDRAGFDIDTPILGVNIAYAVLTLKGAGSSESASQLFQIDLATGAATSLGFIGGGDWIHSIAVVVPDPAIPEPASLGLIACGAMMLAGRRRRKA